MSDEDTPNLTGAARRGCLLALMSACITSLMLFINGSIIWAILSTLAEQGISWAAKTEVTQFLLFALPVALSLIQWKLVDYIRHHVWT